MIEKEKSVYVAGAENGLILGPVMALTVVLMGASTYVMWLSIPALLVALAVPVLAYLFLYRSFMADSRQSFSALWLQGICMFFFGGVIMMAVAFAALRWGAPGFVVHQLDTIIEIYGSVDSPDAASIASTFKKIRDNGPLPSPLDMSLELLYLAVFSGSILSMVYSFLIRRRVKR